MEDLGLWSEYAGKDRPEWAWLLHPGDVWVKNPHYTGPPVGHPEDCDDDDGPSVDPDRERWCAD